MRSLWIRSFELFRKHPILWAPCTVAGFLKLALDRILRAALKPIFMFFATQHSVLGGDVASSDLAGAQRKASMVLVPFRTFNHFLEVCIFVLALVITNRLVCAISEAQVPDLKKAIKEGLHNRLGIFKFSAIYFVALGMVGLALAGLYEIPVVDGRLTPIFASRLFQYSVSAGFEACVAWFLLPSAIRLLQAPNPQTVPQEFRVQGTLFNFLASLTTFGLYRLIALTEAHLVLNNQWEINTTSAVNTFLAILPEVLLFIFLALLAAHAEYGDPAETRDPLTPLLSSPAARIRHVPD